MTNLKCIWDLPEYDKELENGPMRPDGKIINKAK